MTQVSRRLAHRSTIAKTPGFTQRTRVPSSGNACDCASKAGNGWRRRLPQSTHRPIPHRGSFDTVVSTLRHAAPLPPRPGRTPAHRTVLRGDDIRSGAPPPRVRPDSPGRTKRVHRTCSNPTTGTRWTRPSLERPRSIHRNRPARSPFTDPVHSAAPAQVANLLARVPVFRPNSADPHEALHGRSALLQVAEIALPNSLANEFGNRGLF